MTDKWFGSEQIDATIAFAKITDSNGDYTVQATWHGGTTAGFTKELMDDLDPLYARRDGDIVIIADMRLKIVGFDGRTYLVQRITD